MKQALLCGIIVLDFISAAACQEPGGNYRLWPVTTDLQRLLLSADARVYGLVNSNGLVQDGKIDAAALPVRAFRRDLAALAKEHPGNCAITLRFQNWQSQ